MDYVTPTHLEILDVLNQIEVLVIADNHKVCKSDKFDGYYLITIDPLNESGKNELVICVNSIQKNHYNWIEEVNRTITHESIHVAQSCKSDDGRIRPLGFRNSIEDEAYAVQDQPKEVLRILKKYCL
jgi:hypothetical protein